MEAAAEVHTVDRASVMWCNVLHIDNDATVMKGTEANRSWHADESHGIAVCNVRH